MTHRSPVSRLVVVSLLVMSFGSAAKTSQLGRVDFPTSGAAAAQDAFLRGVRLLHSFEYDDAREAFQEAERLDPAFAMAYWGEAITYNHAVWQETNPEAAQAALARLAPSLDERRAKAPTAKEKDWLASLEPLYGPGDKRARDLAYADHMRRMYERYPDDLEVASFYALALLGTSHGGRDVSIYMKAAAIVEEVVAKNPQHPGAAHYLIHSYDDPIHAPLGMRYANAYGKIAPDASHALHMPSHIYFAMGLWDEAAAMNERSWQAADDRVTRKKLSVEDRGFHALLWLEYSYLQQGRYEDAKRLLQIMEADAAKGGSVRTRTHLALMRAAWIVDTRRWATAKTPLTPGGPSGDASAADLFAIGYAALKNDNRQHARQVLEALQAPAADPTRSGPTGRVEAGSAHAGMPMSGYATSPARAATIMAQQLEGAILLDEGRADEALALLKQAAAGEDALSFEFGPPVPVKPAHELIGEALLALKRPAEARVEFEAALKRAPRRTLSLLGLARAAAAAGDAVTASRTYGEVRSIWHRADKDLPEWKELAGATSSAHP